MLPTLLLMRLLVAGALFLILGLTLYGDGLGAYFLGDDFAFVEMVHQEWEKQPWQFLQRFVAPYEGSHDGGFHRPMSFLTLGLDYAVWGTNAVGFHITNLLIHMVCALLVWRLLWSWTGRQGASLLAGLLFLVFPLHPDAVIWIVGRDEMLAVLFTLVVMNWLPTKVWLLCLVSLCAIWSKESALMLAPVITVYHMSVSRQSFRHAIRSSLWIWILTLIYILDRWWVIGAFGGTYPGYDPPDYLTWDYLMTRLDYLVVMFAPLEGETFATWLRWVVGLVTLALVASSLSDRRAKPGLTTFLVCWLLLAPMPYLWENIDLHSLQHARHLYPVSVPFCMLLALGSARVAQRFLPASGAVCGMAAATLIVLFGCATWLTKQGHLQASEICRKIVEDAHRQLDRERERPAGTVCVVFQNVPPIHMGAHIGVGMSGAVHPPFFDPIPLEAWILNDSDLIPFVVSYLKEAQGPGLVVRYVWDKVDERFRRQQNVEDAVTLRGVIQPPDVHGFRLRHHDIRVQGEGDQITTALGELVGNTVELSGRLSSQVREVRTIQVASVHRVRRILEVPEVVHAGGRFTVRIHGRPNSYYALFQPNRSGFLPLHEFGTFLVAVDVNQFASGKVPASGVAVHTVDVPANVPAGNRFYYQAIIERQDPEDPRLFILTACPGLVVRSR